MKINLSTGVLSDLPWVTPFGNMKAGRGLNIRWRLGQLETLGLFGALRDLAGVRLQVPLNLGQPVRALYTAQSSAGVQILAGAMNRIDLITVDPASPPGGDTRYEVVQLGGALVPVATDTLPNPTLKNIVIPPVWWFDEQENVIIGNRAGVNESVRAWDRNPANAFDPIPAYEPGDPLGSPSGEAPKKAVGGAILNGIAVLLGCVPFGGTGMGDELMTVRWSARRNFELWNPLIVIDPVTGQLNISGEFQLDNGSRIVGGGGSVFGVVVWTDKSMFLVTETGDLANVLGREAVAGAAGMLSNRAWCEVDARVWWLDGSRTLTVYDGGRPQEIENPLRRGTIDRVNEIAAARIYLTANAEYGEVAIWYPSGDSTECDRAIVYNYRENAWSIWGLSRAHWFQRQGIQEAVAVDLTGTVFAHDIGPGCPNAYRPDEILPIGPGTGCGAGTGVGASNLDPITGFVEYGPMVAPEAASETFSSMRLLMSWLPTPAIGAETDTLDITMMGYENGTPRDIAATETQTWTQEDSVKDYRIAGRSISMQIRFDEIKTVYRLGYVDMMSNGSDGGER